MVACLSLGGEGLDIYEIRVFPFTASAEGQEPLLFPRGFGSVKSPMTGLKISEVN